MTRITLAVFAGLVACGLICLCPSVAAEEIKYPSPDGRFALRITQTKDNEDQPTVELIEKDSGKVMLTLHDGSDTEVFDASDSVLVWSPDSKRVAYGFRANPPGARVEERSALVCFWNGSGFDKVSERKRREPEPVWRRRYAGEVVEVRRSGHVQRGYDVLAR